MNAIVVRQPWATLIALGIKTIETRPAPPNGPMRPEGVRGLPGCSLERGERIAIVAGATPPDPMTNLGRDWRVVYEADPFGEMDTVWAVTHRTHKYHLLPLGAVVCTVTVEDALPIVGEDGDLTEQEPPCIEHRPRGAVNAGLWVWPDPASGDCIDATDQLPLGDFTPGRWGWLLGDPQAPTEACECGHRHRSGPIPCKGRQGVFELPADIAEALS